MMKTLTIFLSALMIAGFEAIGLEDFGSPIEMAQGPTSSTFQEWNDHGSSSSDVSKKRRKKKRRKSSSRRGGGAMEQGAMVMSLGYGTPNLSKTLFSVWEIYEGFEISGIGPLHAKFEYGIGDKFGLGLSVNFVQSKVRWTELDFFGSGTTYSEGFDYMGLAANVRGNWHFVNTDALSVYWGMGLGYSYADYVYWTDYENATPLTLTLSSPFGFESTVGARYFFTDNIGAYMEVGFAKSIVQAGLSFKF